MFSDIRESLEKLYLDDQRPWLIGFSGGKDSTMVASLIIDAIQAIPKDMRTKQVFVLCTDTRVEIPVIRGLVEATLNQISELSKRQGLGIETHLLKPPPEQSFWVNIIGRGYPPPNRVFRWCTQRLKIDPVSSFVQQKIGNWGEAILHLGARRSESSTRAQAMAGRETRKGLRKHPDLPCVWVNNPIEFLTTEEVWAYLLQHECPWGGDMQALYRVYANASGGECPIQIDTSTPACGNSRFGCWTCTVVTRDKASEGLLHSGDEVMEHLLSFRERLIEFRDPASGWRDPIRMNGSIGPGPLTMAGRKALLAELLELQSRTGLQVVSSEELLLIQQMWKAARQPDDGCGVARIVQGSNGVTMRQEKSESNGLQQIRDQVIAELGVSENTLKRLLAKIEEYSEKHRAHGLPNDLKAILKDDLSPLAVDELSEEQVNG